MNYSLEERPIHKIEIDPSILKSGDVIQIMRLDGLDPFIMYGSGSHTGHCATVLRFEDSDEPYIIESQSGWYWPYSGIQRNKWSDWIKFATAASFHVSLMPLNPEARSKYNETAAREFFKETEGLSYGYHNFLLGWIDTPEDNYPPLLAPKIVPIIFSMLERIFPEQIDIFIG